MTEPASDNAPAELLENLYVGLDHPLTQAAHAQGIEIRLGADFMDFIRGDKIVRIAIKHFIYGTDIVNSFDYYFSAVEHGRRFGKSLVDYSQPKYHDVVGYPDHPVFFPSLAEPMVTTTQYMEFAGLSAGMTALDLGAYCGLTSLIFKSAVGKSGTVVAVEADEQNLAALKRNFALYQRVKGDAVHLLEGAVWKDNGGLEFSSEGNMGSSAASIVGTSRGNLRRVASYTLSTIVEKFALERLDFVKCDVEGAEAVIFEDARFFERFRPRIIIETHLVNNLETTDKCIEDIEVYGYTCNEIHQDGVTLPLLECYPPA